MLRDPFLFSTLFNYFFFCLRPRSARSAGVQCALHSIRIGIALFTARPTHTERERGGNAMRNRDTLHCTSFNISIVFRILYLLATRRWCIFTLFAKSIFDLYTFVAAVSFIRLCLHSSTSRFCFHFANIERLLDVERVHFCNFATEGSAFSSDQRLIRKGLLNLHTLHHSVARRNVHLICEKIRSSERDLLACNNICCNKTVFHIDL